jgi:tetratricopeptide (TPR) repeat protein
MNLAHRSEVRKATMPPLLQDRWPIGVRELCAEVDAAQARSDAEQARSAWARVDARLNELEAAAPDLPAQRRLAYAHFDLGAHFRQRGQREDAKRHYRQAEYLWATVANSEPASFEAHAQRAACLNHLGLLALDAGETDQVEGWFRQALDERQTAGQVAVGQTRQPDYHEQSENIACFFGTLCNLGHLYRQRWPDSARQYYERAIQGLEDMLPKQESDLDREMREHHADMWASIYGVAHWTVLATSFLVNARAGVASLDQEVRGNAGGPGAANQPDE